MLPKHLEHILGVSNDQLLDITENIDDYYYKKVEIKRNPDGSPKIKNGVEQKRVMYPSKEPLKSIQKRIKTKILAPVPLPDCVRGGVKGHDNISNARAHQGKKYHFVTDLRSFYPSIYPPAVYAVFTRLGFPPDIARLLTKLTTYKYQLPQGAPTSTHLANLVFLSVDLEIVELCEKYDITYTRWVDDLSFSSGAPFKEKIDEILDIVQSNGFKISHRKTGYIDKCATITGIDTMNNELRIRKDQMEDLKNADLPKETLAGKARYAFRVNPRNKKAKVLLESLEEE